MHDKVTCPVARDAMRVDKGSITGYAVTWDFDGDGFRYTKGCFDKSIREREGKIPLLVEHAANGGATIHTTVGFLTRCVEDDKGLLITADFLDTEMGQGARERALAGGIIGMSLGTRHLQGTIEDNVRVVKEAMLVEVTLTNIPADAKANVTNVREEGATTAPPERAEDETPSLTTTPMPERAEDDTSSRTTTAAPEEPSEGDTPEAKAERERIIVLLQLGAK